MSLAVGSARTLVLRFSTLAVQVPTSILLARFLGVEGKGLYTLLTVVPWLTAYVLLIGQDTAQTWVLSSRRSRLGPVIRYCVALLLTVSPLALAAYFWVVAPRVMESVPGALVAAAGLLIPLVVARYLVLSLILGYERVVRFNIYYLATSVLILLLVVVLVGIQGRGLPGALAAFITAQAVVIPLGIWWIARCDSEDKGGAPRGSLGGIALVRRCLAYGLKGHPAGLLATFNQRFDIFLMGALSDASQVGLYVIAVAMAETIWHIPMSIHLNLFPRVSAEGGDAGAERLPRAFRMTVMLCTLLALLLVLAGRLAIGLLFGEQFLPSFIPLVILLPGVLAMAAANVFESYFAGVNKRQFQSYSAGCAFGLGVAMGLWLIPRYGAAGAAAASTVSYTLQMIISISLGGRVGAKFNREYLAFGLDDIRTLVKVARDMTGRGERK
jgi:O-antigen/teichoic acid export membrane protein